MICPGIASSKHIHHTFLTIEAILLQKNIRWTGRAHCAGREAEDLIFTPYSICHREVLYTWTEGLEQEDVPTQTNRLGKKILPYFYLHLVKK